MKIRLRYRFTADLPTAEVAIIDPDRLTWVEETTYDLAGLSSRVKLLPDHYASKLEASASARFVDRGDGSIRDVAGDLRVRVLLANDMVDLMRDDVDLALRVGRPGGAALIAHVVGPTVSLSAAAAAAAAIGASAALAPGSAASVFSGIGGCTSYVSPRTLDQLIWNARMSAAIATTNVACWASVSSAK